MTDKPKAVGLKEAARRLGMSYDTARKRIADGRFPIPALRRHGAEWWKFSEYDIERYLRTNATEDAQPGVSA